MDLQYSQYLNYTRSDVAELWTANMPMHVKYSLSGEWSITIILKQCNMQVEGIQVHANEGGVTQTRGGVYWLILPAGCNSLLPLKTRFLISVFLV